MTPCEGGGVCHLAALVGEEVDVGAMGVTEVLDHPKGVGLVGELGVLVKQEELLLTQS